MTTVLNIINQVADTSGKLEKIRILTENKDNADLRMACYLAYTPTINFYSTHTEAGKASCDRTLSQAFEALLIRVASRELTGNAAKEFMGDIVDSLSADDAEIFKRVVLRDLRAGFSESTINKVWPNLVPTFDFLLADTDPSRIVYPAISQLKADGMRAAMFIEPISKGVAIMSRNGKQIDVRSKLNKAALAIMGDRTSSATLDGELICMQNGAPLSRKVSNGILNKAIKGTISDEEAELVHFLAWDVVDEESKIPYAERLGYLTESILLSFTKLPEADRRIQLLETREVANAEEALEHFKEQRRKGLEGTIVKNRKGVWVPKRSKDLCKFKAEVEGDFRVTGFEYGTGKNANRVGNLLVETEDGLVKTAVGIFKDFDENIRDELLVSMPSIVTILYNERITDKSRKDGTESLFLPRVTALRWDKSEANTRQELISIEEAIIK